jgi:hypothetical protein
MAARNIIGLVVVVLLVLNGAPSSVLDTNRNLLKAGAACDPSLRHRTPQQVLEDWRAARSAGNWAAVRCNLDDDAVMISDNGVTNGTDEIITELQALHRFFGGNFDQVYQEIVVNVLGGNRHMARVLYTVDTTCADVPDGIDTYVIKGGQIAAMTLHGFIQFSC